MFAAFVLTKNKIMKKIFLFLLPLAIVFTIASCSKEGPAGPAGADGKDGNANVIVVTGGADTLTATDASIDVLLPASVSPGTIDSSLVLVYFKGNPNQGCNYWYQSPGLGCNSEYQTRWIYLEGINAIRMSIRNADGSIYTGTDRYVSSVKVVIAKGNAFFTGKKEIEFSSYEAAKAFFGLKD